MAVRKLTATEVGFADQFIVGLIVVAAIGTKPIVSSHLTGTEIDVVGTRVEEWL